MAHFAVEPVRVAGAVALSVMLSTGPVAPIPETTASSVHRIGVEVDMLGESTVTVSDRVKVPLTVVPAEFTPDCAGAAEAPASISSPANPVSADFFNASSRPQFIANSGGNPVKCDRH